MKRYNTILVILLLMVSMLIIPTPVNAFRYSKDSDLSNVDASFIGEKPGFSGKGVAFAGDVNGDGYDDILIGAFGDTDGGSQAGQTYLILGNSSSLVMDNNLANANASFIGEDTNDGSGWSIAGAGDVNSDGFDDILIGAWGDEDVGGDQAGQTYLILGKATGWTMDNDLSNSDASFIGEDSWDQSGFSVAGAGDVNGDGYGDILIGARFDEDGGNAAGQTYLILGKSSGWTMDTDLVNADASFIGEDADDFSGYSVAGAGDVNGDGYDDILIGAFQDDDGGSNAGQTYIILGKAGGWIMDLDLSNADASFIGEDANDFSGFSVAGAGDVNGDGYDDILIGAYGDDDGGSAAGQTYLILGKSSGWTMDNDLANADASFIGEDNDDYSGISVAEAGDINGDGYDDILIGAEYDEEGGNEAGQTYLILGKSTGWSMDNDLANADASFIGEDVGDRSGGSVAGAEDFNGDGYDDVLIGAICDDDGGNNAGQTYLIFPDLNSKPYSISSLEAYSEDTFSTEISKANVNDMIYIELQGNDGNSSRADIALVNVRSSDSSQMGFNLRLYESGLNTGKYRGSFTIKNRTHDNYHWIKASIGESITVSSIQDPFKKVMIFVGELVLYPIIDDLYAQEDGSYNAHYSTIDLPNIDWLFETNASWLDWNLTSYNLTGMPDNSDVGSYWVRINITKGPILTDEHNFTLVVNNTPPDITTDNIVSIKQNEEYVVDYNSSDDDQGIITWHLTTNGSWLQIDAASGTLTGTPMNADVGSYWVNVAVDDGNGGWDSTNFTLLVSNVNDPPVILTNDTLFAFEDEEYKVYYKAMDIDTGDEIAWTWDSNASFLAMDSTTNVLSGTPTNDDVGNYWINITVTDRALTSDTHYFILTVININDPPVITSEPIVEATVFNMYEYQLNVSDVDKGNSLWYALDIYPDNMTINSATGLITWKPDSHQIGDNQVIVRVSDFNKSDTQVFNISVTLYNNNIIEITSDPIMSATVGEQYRYEVMAEDDYKDDLLDFFLIERPENMVIDSETGLIIWVPNDDQIGKHTVTVRVSDNKLSGFQTFEITVTLKNNKPVVSGIPEQTIKVGESFRYHVVASDIDIEDVLTFRLNNKPSGMKINSTGVIYWTPAKDQVGKHIITINVSDWKDSTIIEFTINVIKEDTPRDSASNAMALVIGSIVIILIIVLLVVALILIKRKGKEELKDKLGIGAEGDTQGGLEGEILQTPASGVKPMPQPQAQISYPEPPPTGYGADQLVIQQQLVEQPYSGTVIQQPTGASELHPLQQQEDPQQYIGKAPEHVSQLPKYTQPRYPEPQTQQQQYPKTQEQFSQEQISQPSNLEPEMPQQQVPQQESTLDQLSWEQYPGQQDQFIQPPISEPQSSQPQYLPSEEMHESYPKETYPPEQYPSKQTQAPQQPEPVQTITDDVCMTCGQPLSYFAENDSYYCYHCKKYE